MRHTGDGVGLDHIDPVTAPHLVRIAVDLVFHWRRVDPVNIGPLQHQRIRIHRLHGRVGIAVPDRDARPRTAVCRLTPYQVAPFPCGVRPPLKHAFECLLHIARSPIRQSRDDRAGREHLRIRGEHRGRHRAAGGEPGDENLAAIDAVRANRLLDHLADRERLAAAARGVTRQEPVEAGLGIVGLRLLRQQQDETVSLSKRRPSGAEIVACGRLGAAVQNDDQCRRRAELFRNVGEHPQRAGIRSETRQLGEVIGSGR